MVNGPLEGRVGIVTGSTSGIGLATATALAAAGCRVLMHGSGVEQSPPAVDALRARGADVAFLAADLTNPHDAACSLRSEALDRWGRIDVVVSNAATILHTPYADVTEADWFRVLAVNLVAPFELVQACTPSLRESRGRVVLVSSVNALQATRSNFVYDISKTALNRLGEALALELREDGIRVNTLMPGGTDTPGVRRWARNYAGDIDTAKALVDSDAVSGRLASPEQIAAGVMMLVTTDAEWMTGATIAFDGGMRLGPPPVGAGH